MLARDSESCWWLCTCHACDGVDRSTAVATVWRGCDRASWAVFPDGRMTHIRKGGNGWRRDGPTKRKPGNFRSVHVHLADLCSAPPRNVTPPVFELSSWDGHAACSRDLRGSKFRCGLFWSLLERPRASRPIAKAQCVWISHYFCDPEGFKKTAHVFFLCLETAASWHRCTDYNTTSARLSKLGATLEDSSPAKQGKKGTHLPAGPQTTRHLTSPGTGDPLKDDNSELSSQALRLQGNFPPACPNDFAHRGVVQGRLCPPSSSEEIIQRSPRDPQRCGVWRERGAWRVR